MKKYSTFCICLLGLGLYTLQAQFLPQPAPKQADLILITNATIHTGTGEVLENASLLMEDGKITQIGNVEADADEIQNINAQGKHIYPGLIVIGTNMGLQEIGAVRATNDHTETGNFNPNARALVAYNTDSRVIPTVRSNGILMAQIAPGGSLFQGLSSVVQLDAWNYEDAVLSADDAVYLNWPNMSIRTSSFAPPVEVQKKNQQKNLAKIEEAFEEAGAYRSQLAADEKPKHNLQLEALVPVLEGKRKLFVRANREKQIIAAVALAQKYDLDMVILGGAEAWLQVDLLKQHDIPVVLTKVHNLPERDEDDYDAIYKQAARLQEAGITFALTMTSSWACRNLPFQAGSAAAYGLTKEQALTAISYAPAQILGMDEQMGSLAVGKDATLIICEGDLLDMRTSVVEAAFIQGRQINLSDKQKILYERFKAKYNQR